jgi:hypothetical protein
MPRTSPGALSWKPVEVENASVVVVDVAHRGVRLKPMIVGYLWGIRTEVVAGQAFALVTVLQPWDCKSIVKASKVRILHLPPRAREGAASMRVLATSSWPYTHLA